MSRKFKLEIECDNAAFDDGDVYFEIAVILQDVSKAVSVGEEAGSIYDSNGNRVGWFAFDDPEGDDE